MVTKTPAFEQAIKDSRNLKAKPTNDELLKVRLPASAYFHRFGHTHG